MKNIFFVLALVLLVISNCWAKKKESDADKFLLDGNHANSFLVQKRTDWVCSHVQEKTRENEPEADVDEECCFEGCSREEMDENVYPSYYSNWDGAEDWRERYVAECC